MKSFSPTERSSNSPQADGDSGAEPVLAHLG
jgi:hypothetical protein